MRIAVDFDGTIVTHKYPRIGKKIPFAIEALRMLQKEHLLILWTVREGKLLQEAVDYCKQHGVVFYAVNANNPCEEPKKELFCRKVNADLFIDDRNVGGLPDWGIIYRMIEEEQNYERGDLISNNKYKSNKILHCFKKWISASLNL